MSSEMIAKFLDNWSAGTVFLLLVGVYTVAKKVIEIYKTISSHIEKKTTKKIKSVETIEGIIGDINSLKADLENMSTEVENYKGMIDNKLEEMVKSSSDGSKEFLEAFNEMKSIIVVLEPKMKFIEEKISKLESQIGVLITSDVEYIKAYLTDSYKKFVKEKHHIDLISLQNVESLYNRFLQETGVEDEFLSKLMRELRNLPTTKGEDEDD